MQTTEERLQAIEIKLGYGSANTLCKNGTMSNEARLALIEEKLNIQPPPENNFTWEKCFAGKGFFIYNDSTITNCSNSIATLKNTNLFRTEKQALSALAFSQLTHIMAVANEGLVIASDKVVYQIGYLWEEKKFQVNDLVIYTIYQPALYFFSDAIALLVLEQNKSLFKQYFMVD